MADHFVLLAKAPGYVSLHCCRLFRIPSFSCDATGVDNAGKNLFLDTIDSLADSLADHAPAKISRPSLTFL